MSNPEEIVYYDSLEGEIHQITKKGENTESYYSVPTNKLLFIRNYPPEHRTPQVIEKNMVDKTERQVTYNLGENHSPYYHPYKSWIMYSSSADELIEKINITPAMQELGLKSEKIESTISTSQEIYISIKNSSTKRITREKGFDGLAVFSQDGEKIYYVKRDKTQSHIVEYNIKSGDRKTIHTDKNKILSLSVAQGLIAWTYQSDVPTDNERLIIKKIVPNKKTKNREIVFEGASKYHFSDVEIHKSQMRILVIANIDDTKNKDVYQIDIAEKCATRFSFHPAEESHPTFGPEGRSLFFVSNRSKINQIYSTLIRPTLTCKPLE